MVPLVFYDMQARYVHWLGHAGQRVDWARDMALELLPVYFFPALCCKFNRHTMGGILERTRDIFALFPDMKIRFIYHALWHTRPGIFLLRLVRGKPEPPEEEDKGTPSTDTHQQGIQQQKD